MSLLLEHCSRARRAVLPLMVLTASMGVSGCSSEDPGGSEDPALAFLLERHDRDADGRIGAEEYGRDLDAFARMDRSGDGWIDQQDFALLREERARTRARRREEDSRSQEGEGAGTDGLGPRGSRPLQGRMAPDLLLARLEGGDAQQLSDLWADRPVLLVFGSWT